MNLKTGYPYPLIRNGLPVDYPKLEKDLRADVLILGGGISGALTAHYLMEAGIDCVIVDGRSVGLGSTCASTSLLQYEIDTPLTKLVEKVGKKNAERSYILCANSIIKLGKIAAQIGLKDFRFKPSLQYARFKKEIPALKQEESLRKNIGLDLEFFDASRLKKEFGFDSPGGLFSRLGADTDSYLFTHLLHRYNLQRGLRVFDRSPVVDIQHNRDYITIKTANGCQIRSNKLVYATGYEIVNFIDKKIARFKTTFATIGEPLSRPVPYWKSDALIWSTGDPYLYMRSTSDNRIVVGGKDVPTIDRKKMTALIPSKTRALKKDFDSLFPDISFIPEFSWAGVFGSTKDGLPYIGTYKKLPNSFFALGFGGNGITFSQVAGEIIADLVSGKRNEDAKMFSFERS